MEWQTWQVQLSSTVGELRVSQVAVSRLETNLLEARRLQEATPQPKVTATPTPKTICSRLWQVSAKAPGPLVSLLFQCDHITGDDALVLVLV